MNIRIIEHNNVSISLVESEAVLMKTPEDALSFIMNAGSRTIIVHQKNFAPEFFDLASGLAGSILQKFSNYRVRLGIVGDFSQYQSKSLRNFIRESNRSGAIVFMNTVADAVERLAGKQ